MIYFDIETVNDHVLSDDETSAMREKYPDFDFMPEFHRVLTIAVGRKDDDGRIRSKNLEGNENEQISAFFKMAQGNQLCGYNIKGFDIPFIVKRAIRLNVPIPPSLKMFGKKPWDMDNLIDLKDVWKHAGSRTVSLDILTKFLGIPTPKQGIDGSQVQSFHDQ